MHLRDHCSPLKLSLYAGDRRQGAPKLSRAIMLKSATTVKTIMRAARSQRWRMLTPTLVG